MKRALLIIVIILMNLVASGCNLYSSSGGGY